jgi:glycosyltransferase involved in cell wall biosynthesis
LIYLIKPFLYESDDSELIGHQNNRRCIYISAILDELGYIVDAVDINDKYFRPSRHYDLVISARNNLFKMDDYFDDNVIRIYIATSLYHPLHNSNIRRRHELLYERRGRGVEPRRIYPESMQFVKNADAIIAVGNEFITRTWHEALNVPAYPFNNFGWRETEFLIDRKDFSSARRNFLFFASKSQMQKGLDLLLEIFPKHTDLHLYICSEFANEKDFCTCYHKELYETPNIHPIGWIKVNGPKYNDLVKKCAFVIHPTCSEGQPGSVVQCMYSGLIPLVTKESGIDTEDFGITFADDSLEEIEKAILEVSRLPESWHRERSSRTRRVSEMKYSEDALVERWRNILAEVLNCAG